MIQTFHGSITEINQFISDANKSYKSQVKIINLSSTPSGFDLFYEFIKKEKVKNVRRKRK